MAGSTGAEKVNGVRVLALCGRSLLIESLEASLRGSEGVEIVLLDTSRADATEILGKLSPDIIVFDLTPNQLSCVYTFLQMRPNVVLVGLNMECDRALVLSGEWRRLPTVADLRQLIETRIQAKSGG